MDVVLFKVRYLVLLLRSISIIRVNSGRKLDIIFVVFIVLVCCSLCSYAFIIILGKFLIFSWFVYTLNHCFKRSFSGA